MKVRIKATKKEVYEIKYKCRRCGEIVHRCAECWKELEGIIFCEFENGHYCKECGAKRQQEEIENRNGK